MLRQPGPNGPAEIRCKAHCLTARQADAGSGLRVPAAVGDFMMLDAIRASGGLAVAGREGRIVEWMRRVASREGIALCPEAAVCFDCLEALVKGGQIGPDEEVIVFNTGAAQKYPEAVPLDLPRLDKNKPVDYAALTAAG